MSGIAEWVKGEKHPKTALTSYLNVRGYDQVRRALPGRCAICGFVVSRDEKAVREISIKCKDSKCCTTYITTKPHQVCHLCYDMHHSLYLNVYLKNMNYFKELDEKEKKSYDDFKRRE